MPYAISQTNPECDGWAVEGPEGEALACHTNKQDAIDQAVAISLQTGEEFVGERKYLKKKKRDLPDNYRPATSEDVPEGRACGNCLFFDESNLDPEGRAFCTRWEEYVEGGQYCDAWEPRETEERVAPDGVTIGDFVSWSSSGGRARGKITRIVREGRLPVPNTDFVLNASEDNPAALIDVWRPVRDGWIASGTIVGHRFATLTKIDPLPAPSDDGERLQKHFVSERRQVNLTPPAYMRAAARQGLRYHEEGKSGDGLVPRTVREARAMAEGNVTADKWVRIAAWIARHLVDLDAPDASPDHEDYPSPGVVAHLLWGSGPSKRAAERALAYARGVVDRLEAENADRGKGKTVAKIETRVSPTQFEIRETSEGMTFEGYAALFDSPSEPLPFIERIAPGAFTRSLKSRNEIKMLWNHDTGEVLGSVRAGTLQLSEDDRGLKVWAMLPNTSTGRDAAELIRRGDVDSMSFGFSVPRNGDSWSSDGTERTLNEIRLHEVSIVAFPAYSSTAGTTSVRGLERLAERADVDADALADALLKVELGDDITSDDRDLLERVLEKLAPASSEEETSETDLAMLALKKKKLELLMGL